MTTLFLDPVEKAKKAKAVGIIKTQLMLTIRTMMMTHALLSSLVCAILTPGHILYQNIYCSVLLCNVNKPLKEAVADHGFSQEARDALMVQSRGMVCSDGSVKRHSML